MDLLISAVPGPPFVKDFIRGCYKVFNEIYGRFQKVKDNAIFQKRIKERIEELKKVLKYLETIELVEFPQVCVEHLQKFNESIKKCWEKCEELHNKGVLRKFATVYAHESELKYMEEHLKEANTHLQLTLPLIQLQQTKEGFEQTDANLKERFAQTSAGIKEEIKRDSIPGEYGIYHGASADGRLPVPTGVAQPHLSEDRQAKLLIVMWTDYNNTAENIVRYEVQYDPGTIVHGTPKKLSVGGSDTKFSLKLSYPRVSAKQSYIIRVRAISKHAPSPWSESNTIRFLSDRPSKPKRPGLNAISPTQVAVEIQLLKQEEMNGSPVLRCAIECKQVTVKEPSWECCSTITEYDFGNSEMVETTVESFEPDTRYSFRIIMINEIGESPPSDECEILTRQLLPSIPQSLRISSKRTDRTLKIRWEPPLMNPGIVQCYHAQIRRAKSKSDSWNTIPIPIHAINKLSAKATNLKTDTKYLFRVQAVNDRGESGGFTNSVEGETRVGKAARIAATTGAFFGGTIGGPLLGAVGGGIAATVGDDKSKSKAVAAGIGGSIGGAILGTIGAPIMGGVAAVAAYSGLKHGYLDDSPQTSDDEETKERKKIAENSLQTSDDDETKERSRSESDLGTNSEYSYELL